MTAPFRVVCKRRAQAACQAPTHLLWMALGATLVSGCALDEVDKPPAPDTSDYERRLAQPDGRFPEGSTAQEIFQRAEEALEGFGALCDFEPLRDPACLAEPACRQCAVTAALADAIRAVVRNVRQAADAGADAGDGEGIPGVRGVLFVDALCRGFADPPVVDPDNGRFSATLGFTGRGVDPVVWGEADNCALSTHEVRVTGELIFAFEASAVRASNFETTPVLFAFEGSVRRRGSQRDTPVNVIVLQRLDGRGPLVAGFVDPEGGSFVLQVDAEGAEVRSGGGTFVCDAEVERCQLTAAP